MERLAREKISAQQRLAVLKKEIAAQFDGLDFSRLLPELPPPRTHCVSPKPSDAVSPQQELSERVPIPPLPRLQQNIQFVNGTKEVINRFSFVLFCKS